MAGNGIANNSGLYRPTSSIFGERGRGPTGHASPGFRRDLPRGKGPPGGNAFLVGQSVSDFQELDSPFRKTVSRITLVFTGGYGPSFGTGDVGRPATPASGFVEICRGERVLRTENVYRAAGTGLRGAVTRKGYREWLRCPSTDVPRLSGRGTWTSRPPVRRVSSGSVEGKGYSRRKTRIARRARSSPDSRYRARKSGVYRATRFVSRDTGRGSVGPASTGFRRGRSRERGSPSRIRVFELPQESHSHSCRLPALDFSTATSRRA